MKVGGYSLIVSLPCHAPLDPKQAPVALLTQEQRARVTYGLLTFHEQSAVVCSCARPAAHSAVITDNIIEFFHLSPACCLRMVLSYYFGFVSALHFTCWLSLSFFCKYSYTHTHKEHPACDTGSYHTTVYLLTSRSVTDWAF